MAKRFIKLYEQIVNWEWYRHPNTLALFIYLLLKANYRDSEMHGVPVRRGQLVTSLPKISTDTGLSIQQTRTAIAHLISTGEITDSSTPHYRIITVVKYDDYQTSTDKSTDNQQTTNRQPNRQSTDNLTPYIEYIEDIESNRKIEPPSGERTSAKRFVPPTLDQVLAFCRDENLDLDAERFCAYYDSNGWMVGRNKMKSWQAAARNWAKRDAIDRRTVPTTTAKPERRTVVAQDYPQRDYDKVQDDLMNEQRRHILERLGRL